MATYTDNFSLALPGYGEDADVGVLNDNTEEIDGYMHDSMMISLSMYDATKTYNAGDVVGHQNPSTHRIRAYKCLDDNVTGAWDSTKWEQTNIAAELGQAGASALADLDDVSLTTPTDGQILRRDANGDWVNTDMPDMAVTKEASGNPIDVSDSASAPLVKCVTQITGSQDLHGYDKPWVGGAGKNKLPLVLADIKALNTSGTWNGNIYTDGNVTFSILTDNGNNIIGIVVNGTTDSDFKALSLPLSSSLYGLEIIMSKYYGNNDVIMGIIQNGSTKIVCTTTEVTGTIPSTGTIECYVRVSANKSVSNATVYPMIRLSTETDSTFAPYSNICPITAYDESTISVEDENEVVQQTSTATFSQTIYQGNADFVGGSAECDIPVIDLGDLTWTQDTSRQLPTFRAALTNPKINSGGWNSNVVCEQYYGENAAFTDGSCSIFYNNNIHICDSRYTDATTFSSAVSGVKLAYKLATPTTETITPTNLPMKSLFGYNHIESSTGDMEVEYITKNFQPLLDLMKKMVVANPSADATETLEKLKVDDTVYSLPSGSGGIPSIGATVNTFSLS